MECSPLAPPTETTIHGPSHHRARSASLRTCRCANFDLARSSPGLAVWWSRLPARGGRADVLPEDARNHLTRRSLLPMVCDDTVQMNISSHHEASTGTTQHCHTQSHSPTHANPSDHLTTSQSLHLAAHRLVTSEYEALFSYPLSHRQTQRDRRVSTTLMLCTVHSLTHPRLPPLRPWQLGADRFPTTTHA